MGDNDDDFYDATYSDDDDDYGGFDTYSSGLNPPNGAAFDDVFFKDHGTNPFIDTEDDHFSTFGMDVDTASYFVMRRHLRDGFLPPPEAVRVEEFVNAFDYNYEPPLHGAFAVHIEGAPSKFGEGKRLQLLRIGIQGRVIPTENRKDATLTFVIDVSRFHGDGKSVGIGKTGVDASCRATSPRRRGGHRYLRITRKGLAAAHRD